MCFNSLYSKSYLLYGGIRITSGSNLNDYIEPGNYYCTSNADAASIQNSPTNSAFTMKVEYSIGTSYPCQIVRVYNNRRTAYRFKTSSTDWSDWVYFSDDTTLADNLLSTAPYTVAFDEITPGALQTKSVSVHRAGYKAIGCVGWANTKSSNFYLYQCLVNNSEMLSAFVKNAGDSTIPSGASVIVNVLFVKNS